MAVPLYPAEAPVYLLVAAETVPGKFDRGDITSIRAKGSFRSDWCVLPKWLWITLTDKSSNQVKVYLTSWKIEFVHTLVTQNAEGWHFEIAVDPDLISASELNKNQIKQVMADYLTDCATQWDNYWYGASIHAWTSSSITIDIPKPIQGNAAYGGTDPEWILYYESQWNAFLQELKHDFHDKFAAIVVNNGYKFSEAAVNAVIGMGGEWEGTHTQALNYIVDKLSE